jgi:hypothetical protein
MFQISYYNKVGWGQCLKLGKQDNKKVLTTKPTDDTIVFVASIMGA